MSEARRMRRGVSSRFSVGGGITECINVYDIRLDDTFPACGTNWPYELANITSYLQVRSKANDTGKNEAQALFRERMSRQPSTHQGNPLVG